MPKSLEIRNNRNQPGILYNNYYDLNERGYTIRSLLNKRDKCSAKDN